MVSDGSGLFSTAFGLPMHPLVVHAVVVLLPISAVGLILVLARPRWRTPFGYLALAGLLVGGAATLAAKESGEALASRVGLPQQHANLGSALTFVTFWLIVCALGWFVASGVKGARWWLSIVLAIAAGALAVTTSVLTIAAGHTGASAVWASRVAALR